MNKWDLIEIMRERFSDKEIVDMFAYWMSTNEIERCIEDYLNDRDLVVRHGYVRDK